MIKLIASDMDGTLLDDDSKVPEETYELISALAEKGVRFVASSGRRYDTLRWLFEPVADKMDYVASLGTQVYADGRLLDREVFSTLSVMRLFETTQLFDCLHLALYDATHTYLLNDQSSYIRELDKDLPNAERLFDPPSPDVSIIKAALCCEYPDQLMDMAYVLERELSEFFTFLPSGSRWIDVVPRHVNKATGLEQVMRYWGIGPDEVVAFGDSMNDYAMLRYVGHPYVMENARYAVRQIGQRVIGRNSDHAVQRVMREILEGL
ncbi:HAD family phosphatase [Olsenella sp. SW781]|jgi:Cof subfamily protein (haloacid dehalogenase superfamily)|uniref:HAD family hydrolase n=1 Tax=Olsenella sp. SW781 TaxID=2530046 RepID=UPI00143B6C41|nr:HAD family hydrolase [Olsenella sp. SW781]NJE80413.1 HAD family phosphatase [Olsenella sp. SW781]